MKRSTLAGWLLALALPLASVHGCSCDGGGGLGNCPDEVCNGVDDDCDGLTDEDDAWVDKGETCFVGQGACQAAGVFICDETNRLGSLVCSGAPGTGDTEVCNGVDDDCDGQTDEETQWSNLNDVCRVELGGCVGVGIFVCDPLDPNAASVCDAIAGPPVAEECNGFDDDCDGETDEDVAWADLGTLCFAGAAVCQRPGLMVCDPTDATGPTLCNAVAGTPGTEVCNGVDDDCDGQTDEDALWADKGEVCTSGQGICEAGGILLCDPANAAGPTICSASLRNVGTPETCNGLDDDCDGQTDEGATWSDKGSLCSRGLGACQRTGVLLCDPTAPSGPTVCNAVAGTPSTEVCDRVDNDCDGGTDEDAAWADLGTICQAGSGTCENVGLMVCDTSTPAGPTVCSVGPGAGNTEVCNRIDDDCDGQTDEGAAWTDLGQGCLSGQGVCAQPGVLVCDTGDPTGATVCSATPSPAGAELCNDLDDDCDGSTDEDAAWASKGQSCSGGLGICIASGVEICDVGDTAGPTVCSAAPGPPAAETCNHLDDNCDGQTDDGWVNAASGVYDQATACGNCFTDCTTIFGYPASYGTCDSSGAPTCQMTCCTIGDTHAACDGAFDYFDLNGVPDDGCEFQNDPAALYVSTPGNGGSDGPACGASGSPCETIGYGLGQAVSGGQLRVKVSGGAYYENFSLVGGIDVLGGYNPTTWARNIAANTTVIYGVGGPVSAPDDRSVVSAIGITTATEFGGFVIFGEISTGVAGNSYGIYVEDCDDSLTIRDNLVYAGDGGPGTDAADGRTGTNGINGNIGTAAHDDSTCPADAGVGSPVDPGATGGTLTCFSTDVSGGNGGDNYCPDFDESGTGFPTNPYAQNPAAAMDGSPGNGPAGGAGGLTGWDGLMFKSGGPPATCACYSPPDDEEPTGTPASNGGDGGGGNGGSGCTNTDGIVSGDRWQGLVGAPGINGQSGSGGGGGGAGGGVENYDCNGEGDSDVGGSGGGGGSGGCGGWGGASGEGGGGSFGLYLAFTATPSTVPVITGNTFNTGLGGTGGVGGNGGFGGIGGTGGVGGLEGQAGTNEWCAGGGGRGGEGGNGGAGGGGGGGCGGVSYGIFAAGQGATNLNAIRTGNSYALSGGGGAGGAGGLSLSVAGSDGLTGTEADTNF